MALAKLLIELYGKGDLKKILKYHNKEGDKAWHAGGKQFLPSKKGRRTAIEKRQTYHDSQSLRASNLLDRVANQKRRKKLSAKSEVSKQTKKHDIALKRSSKKERSKAQKYKSFRSKGV